MLSLSALHNAHSAYFTIVYCLTFILQEGHPVLVYSTVDLTYTDYILLYISQTTSPTSLFLLFAL